MSRPETYDVLLTELTWKDVFIPSELIDIIMSYLVFWPDKCEKILSELKGHNAQLCNNRYLLYRTIEASVRVYDLLKDKEIFCKRWTCGRLAYMKNGKFALINYHSLTCYDFLNLQVYKPVRLDCDRINCIGFSQLYNKLIVSRDWDISMINADGKFITLYQVPRDQLSIPHLYKIRTGQIVIQQSTQVHIFPMHDVAGPIRLIKLNHGGYAGILETNAQITRTSYDGNKYMFVFTEEFIYKWNIQTNSVDKYRDERSYKPVKTGVSYPIYRDDKYLYSVTQVDSGTHLINTELGLDRSLGSNVSRYYINAKEIGNKFVVLSDAGVCIFSSRSA